MAECSRGDVIAHPGSSFLEPVKFKLTKPLEGILRMAGLRAPPLALPSPPSASPAVSVLEKREVESEGRSSTAAGTR